MSYQTILALDLAKFKTVLCIMDVAKALQKTTDPRLDIDGDATRKITLDR